jgi:hypothetical protein
MSSYTDLAASGTANIKHAIIIGPRADQVGVETLYFTNAASLYTEPDDDPPNVAFRSVAIGGLKTQRRMGAKPGKDGTPISAFVGVTFWSAGEIELGTNPVVGSGEPNPSLALLEDSVGRPVEIRGGGPFRVDGTVFPFAEYETVYTGVIRSKPEKSRSGRMKIGLSGSKIFKQNPAIEERYRAFGTVAVLAAGEKLASPSDAAWSILTGTVEITCVVRALPAGVGYLIRHDSGGYGIAIDSAGRLGYVHDGGTVAWSSAPLVTIGESLFASASISGDGSGSSASLVVGRRAEFLAEVVQVDLGPVVAPLGSIEIGGGAGLELDAWDARAWNTARTFAQVRAFADTATLDAAGNAEIIEQWKLGDGSGDTAVGVKAFATLTYSTTPLGWASSLEGEDEEAFGGSLAGKSKPGGFGAPFNAPLAMVSQQFSVYQASAPAPLVDLRRLKSNGGPLPPDERLVAVSLGDISFDGAAFVLDPGSGLSAHRMIPGENVIGVLGMKFVVELGGASYNGTYRIAVDGISDDGLKITAVDEFGDPLAVVPPVGDLPAGAILRTADDAILFGYDLATGSVDLPQGPLGTLTTDAVFELGADATASELVEHVLGPVSGSFAVDPVVAGVLPWGSETTDAHVVDRALWSALGYLAELRDGSYRIGTHGAPTSEPVAAAIWDDADVVFDGIERPPLIGKIVRSKLLGSVDPSWRVTVGHGRNWAPFAPGTTTPSLPPAVRERLEEEWRVSWRDIGETRTTAPVGVPENMIKTWIRDRPDAERLLDEVAVRLFSVGGRWLEFQVTGLGLSTVEIGDPLWVQDSEPGLDIAEPTKAIVSYIEDDTELDLVTIEVYILGEES